MAQSHEFWIDPEEFMVAPGEPIAAHLRVGEAFSGGSNAYLPDRFRLFELAQDGVRMPVEGRMGDRPALSQAVDDPGLVVALHVTTDSRLIYNDFAKFEAFVRHKDAGWAVEAHRARGLPDTGFLEVYSRFAKSLIAVGDGAGADQEYGLETEIVVLANPYSDALDGEIPVYLAYQGAPRPDAQIEVFERAPSGDVVISTVRTDANGRASIPVRAGHVYMLDAVVLREPSADALTATGTPPVWESLWANLTFAVPGS
ncbi:MAG: DUF4198 domain-containing protein [Pseudomonadota bacterium]